MDNITKDILELTIGRSLAGTAGGIIAVVMTIFGLAHYHPDLMLQTATLFIGISLFFKGASIAYEYSKIVADLGNRRVRLSDFNGGMAVELLSGTLGIILSILALFGMDADKLISIAIIIFGVGLLLGCAIIFKINSLKMHLYGIEPHKEKLADQMISSALSIQILVGIDAIVLGVLSFAGLASTTLNLVAILAMGTASILTGASTSGVLVENFRENK